MSVKTKLTEIANDIREILDENDGMTLDDMAAKLDTVKTQIVSAVDAVNAVLGDVSTLPEMSEKVQNIVQELLSWIEMAAGAARVLNGRDFNEYIGQDGVLDLEGMKEAFAVEVAAMRSALDSCYSIIEGYGDVKLPDEEGRYLIDLVWVLQGVDGLILDIKEAVQLWYSAALATMHIVNGTDISGVKPEDALKEETMQALEQELLVIQQAMQQTVTAITEMGGTAPSAAEVSRFPDAIRTIKAGVDVKTSSGTLTTTGANGTATVDCGFRPDLVVITGLIYSEGSERYEYQLAFCFPLQSDSNAIPTAAAYTNTFQYGIDAEFTQTSNGFTVMVTRYSSNGAGTGLQNYTFNYTAIKYTE